MAKQKQDRTLTYPTAVSCNIRASRSSMGVRGEKRIRLSRACLEAGRMRVANTYDFSLEKAIIDNDKETRDQIVSKASSRASEKSSASGKSMFAFFKKDEERSKAAPESSFFPRTRSSKRGGSKSVTSDATRRVSDTEQVAYVESREVPETSSPADGSKRNAVDEKMRVISDDEAWRTAAQEFNDIRINKSVEVSKKPKEEKNSLVKETESFEEQSCTMLRFGCFAF